LRTLVLAAAAAFVTLTPATAAPGPITIRIANFTFAAQVVTVPPGAAVTWINDDDIPHTVVADDNKTFRSKVLDSGDRFTFTFATAGTYRYYCSIHPHMTGTVIVKAS
jgi:plastocyanin